MIAVLLIAGGLGAVLRFVTDQVVATHLTSRFPLGTLLVNITGSFSLGLLVGFFGADSAIVLIAGTGLLGGFTTFSTHAVETLRLAMLAQRPGWAAANALATAFACLSAACAGLALGG